MVYRDCRSVGFRSKHRRYSAFVSAQARSESFTTLVKDGPLKSSAPLRATHHDPELANLVGEGLPGDLQQRCRLVLVSLRLRERALDQLPPEAGEGIVVGAGWRPDAGGGPDAVGQVLEINHLAFPRQRMCGADSVLELAHIAWP